MIDESVQWLTIMNLGMINIKSVWLPIVDI